MAICTPMVHIAILYGAKHIYMELNTVICLYQMSYVWLFYSSREDIKFSNALSCC